MGRKRETNSKRAGEPAVHDCRGVFAMFAAVCRFLQGKSEPVAERGAL